MTTEFDPYREWLGIETDAGKPDYYALIGVVRFERDRDKLELAIEKRVGMLQDIAVGGEHTESSQELLNEVAAARLCLLNTERKFAYDAKLKQRQRSQIAAPETATSVPPLNIQSKKPAVVASEAAPEGKVEKQLQMKILVAAMILPSFFLAAGLILYGMYSGSGDSTDDPLPLKQRKSQGLVDSRLDEATLVNSSSSRIQSRKKLSSSSRSAKNSSTLKKPAKQKAKNTKPKTENREQPDRITPAVVKSPKKLKTEYGLPNPVTRSIVLWLDASHEDSLTVDAENRVSGWKDRKTRINAIQNDLAKQPKLIRHQEQRRQSIEFTPPAFLTMPGSEELNPGDKFFVFVVARAESGILLSKGAISNRASGAFAIHGSLNGFPALQLSTDSFIKPKTKNQKGVWLLRGIRNTGKTLMWLQGNGENDGSKRSKTILSSSAPFVIGHPTRKEDCLKGEICELLIYSRAMNPGEQTQVISYLRQKMGTLISGKQKPPSSGAE